MSYINRKIKQLVSKFNKLNINHKNCNPWCKECVPRYIIEGWTSENHDVDEFIKDTIYNAKYPLWGDDTRCPLFLEWVPFDRFEDMKQIGEGGFAKVYSATWVDGKTKYERQDDGIRKKKESNPMKVALKGLNDSQNISVEYLNELQIHWNYFKRSKISFLKFYGMTKNPIKL
ncbi:uncharacterized protein OCT59_004763 [Rhizophagus irregularis]|uniref:uncharacterized protein n=1 Tax=Rhizophagus irregularis TaxID=588596 RepID=UPI00331A1DB4|nr:hypothetical protein OCT59_004763 [Rhizophagus irregularis]